MFFSKIPFQKVILLIFHIQCGSKENRDQDPREIFSDYICFSWQTDYYPVLFMILPRATRGHCPVLGVKKQKDQTICFCLTWPSLMFWLWLGCKRLEKPPPTSLKIHILHFYLKWTRVKIYLKKYILVTCSSVPCCSTQPHKLHLQQLVWKKLIVQMVS